MGRLLIANAVGMVLLHQICFSRRFNLFSSADIWLASISSNLLFNYIANKNLINFVLCCVQPFIKSYTDNFTDIKELGTLFS